MPLFAVRLRSADALDELVPASVVVAGDAALVSVDAASSTVTVSIGAGGAGVQFSVTASFAH